MPPNQTFGLYYFIVQFCIVNLDKQIVQLQVQQMKKTIIFASIVAAMMIANVTAKAETVSTTKVDSNKLISKTESNKLLANGQEKELFEFVNAQNTALASTKEIVLVNKVLDLYNNNTSAFFNLKSTEKVEFNDAVLIYVKNLEQFKTKEATNWLLKLKYTTNTLNFLWNVNQVEVLDNQELDLGAEVTAI